MHVLRQRVPVLSHAQIIEYVTALEHGDAPAHLVEISSRELVPPTDPFSSVATIRRATNLSPARRRTYAPAVVQQFEP